MNFCSGMEYIYIYTYVFLFLFSKLLGKRQHFVVFLPIAYEIGFLFRHCWYETSYVKSLLQRDALFCFQIIHSIETFSWISNSDGRLFSRLDFRFAYISHRTTTALEFSNMFSRYTSFQILHVSHLHFQKESIFRNLMTCHKMVGGSMLIRCLSLSLSR